MKADWSTARPKESLHSLMKGSRDRSFGGVERARVLNVDAVLEHLNW